LDSIQIRLGTFSRNRCKKKAWTTVLTKHGSAAMCSDPYSATPYSPAATRALPPNQFCVVALLRADTQQREQSPKAVMEVRVAGWNGGLRRIAAGP
jgi:hypothetical protein